MSGEHARLMPSSAEQTQACTASVTMQERYPETGYSESAEEGTAAHWVCSVVLADYLECGRHGHHYKRGDFLDTVAPNGVVITEEMLDAVEVYVRDVMETSSRFDGSNWVLLEHRVRMPNLHPENWGTLDNAVVYFDPKATTLVVGDFKYGWLVVEAYENWQLINYTAGLINDLWERGLPMPTYVEFRLVQPRPHHKDGPVRTWTVQLADLTPYFNHLSAKFYEALGPNPIATPGPQCTYCTARHACEALTRSNYAALTLMTGPNPTDLTPDQIGAHLIMLERVIQLAQSQYTGLETQALSLMQHGTGVRGWEWERPEGRLNWVKPVAEVLVLGDMLGKDLRKPQQVITATQALAAGLPESLIKGTYAERKPGTIKLVRANLKKSAAIFGASK